MDIFTEVKNNKRYNPTNSVLWFRKHVTEVMRNVGTLTFVGMYQSWQTTQVKPGTMIMFGYDPKTKDKLPYYDNFPCGICFDASNDHFMCLNIHYLPFEVRLQLMDKLIHFSTQPLDDNTRLKLTWQYLKNIAMTNAVNFSVKKYLFGHVKTRFVNIPLSDWPIAAFLPLARFRKATQDKVFRDYRKIGRR